MEVTGSKNNLIMALSNAIPELRVPFHSRKCEVKLTSGEGKDTAEFTFHCSMYD